MALRREARTVTRLLQTGLKPTTEGGKACSTAAAGKGATIDDCRQVSSVEKTSILIYNIYMMQLKSFDEVPGPPSFPFLGNMLGIRNPEHGMDPKYRKLDGIAPLMIDPPPTSSTTLNGKGVGVWEWEGAAFCESLNSLTVMVCE